MSFLKTLTSLFAPASTGRPDDAGKLAALLITELRLYDEDAVEKARREGVLDPGLEAELERAFALFLDRAGNSEEAKAAFRSEAVRRILPTNPRALEPLLARVERQPPPPTTPR